MKIIYEAVDCSKKEYINQIVTLEKEHYGDNALASIDMLAQVPDERLGSPGIIIAALDSDKPGAGKLVGYIMGLNGHNGICFVSNLVHQDYQGRGIGTKLKEALIKAASIYSDKGYATIWPGNIANLIVNLNKLKWKITGWTEKKYGDNPETDNRFYMQGTLSGSLHAKGDWKSGLASLNKSQIVTSSDELKPKIMQDYPFAVDLSDAAFNYQPGNMWDRFSGVQVTNKVEGVLQEKFYLLFSLNGV